MRVGVHLLVDLRRRGPTMVPGMDDEDADHQREVGDAKEEEDRDDDGDRFLDAAQVQDDQPAGERASPPGASSR